MANLEIGGYEIDDGGGQLTVTEKSSGDTLTIDGSDINPDTLTRLSEIEANQINNTYEVESFQEAQEAVDEVKKATNQAEYGGGKIKFVAEDLHPDSSELPLEVPFGATIEGRGKHPTRINAPDGETIFDITDKGKVTIRDIFILNGTQPIKIVDSPGCYLENVKMRGVTDGLHVAGSWLTRCHNVWVENGSGTAMTFTDSAVGASHGSALVECSANNSDTGLRVENQSGFSIHASDVEGNDERGIHIINASSISISGVYFEANGGNLSRGSVSDSGIDIALSPDYTNDGRSDGISITGSQFAVGQDSGLSEKVAVLLGHTQGVDIRGNKFRKGTNTRSVLEMTPEATEIEYATSNSQSFTTLTGSIDGGNLDPAQFNDGVWSDKNFFGANGVEGTLVSYTDTSTRDNAVEIRVTEPDDVVITADSIAPGSTIRGIGMPEISWDGPALDLNGTTDVTAENLILSGGSNSKGVNARNTEGLTLRNIRVVDASGGRGIDCAFADNITVENCTVTSAADAEIRWNNTTGVCRNNRAAVDIQDTAYANSSFNGNTPEVAFTSGTFTHTGGSSTTETITNAIAASDPELARFDLKWRVSSSVSADFSADVEIASWSYDSANDEVDVELQATWNTDPGSSNDITIEYALVPE